MDIYFNGESDVNGLVTLSENPNIVKIEDEAEGTYARITMLFINNLVSTVTGDGQYYITLFGETITSTNNPQNNNNKRFYISPDTASTAMNVARALRCLQNLSVQFKIIHNQNYATTVLLSARTIGSKWSDFANEVTTNIGMAYLQISNIAGTATNELYNAKINLDIFDGSENVANYLTTLEKNFYNSECAFDISPVLATFSEYGMSKPFHINLSAIGSEGNYIDLGEVSGNSVIGYSANYSERYLVDDSDNGVTFLINDTNCELYTYSNYMEYSLLVPSGTYNWQTTVSIKNSAGVTIYSAETTNTFTHADGSLLFDKSLSLPQADFSSGFTIDITEDNDTKTFKIIKPLNAAENNNRVYFRNCYGGISFFDFTAEETESNSMEIETYEKNTLDFYDVLGMYEVKKVYRNDVTKTITVKSHLISKEGVRYMNDLMKSKLVWVKLSDSHFAYIVPKSIEIQEEQQYDGIFTVKFSFTFSSPYE